MFALLHCISKKPLPKAKALYCLLQDGGFEQHTQISATDKDIIPVFQKICKLVTVDIFTLANQHGGVSNIYNETETTKLVNEENLEILREEDWLEAVFGVQSRLDNDTWLSKVVMKEANWVYDPKQLRAKLFKQAGITSRH